MNNCRNCGKEIPDDKWCCNEECVREYYSKNINENEALDYGSCKNCFRKLPKGLDFCCRNCLDEFKLENKNPKSLDLSSTKEFDYVEADNLFTEWAKQNKKPDDKCEICGKTIADYQRFCSRECIRENKRRVEKKKRFGIYDNELEKIIEQNFRLAQQYVETIRIVRETRPDLRKFSFGEWLKHRSLLH
jgi:predicted nucleic acid-binding Zn ribbon protein